MDTSTSTYMTMVCLRAMVKLTRLERSSRGHKRIAGGSVFPEDGSIAWRAYDVPKPELLQMSLTKQMDTRVYGVLNEVLSCTACSQGDDHTSEPRIAAS